MERVEAHAAQGGGLEATLRHDRRLIGTSLGAIVVLAWLYLWHDAASMAGMDMDNASMTGMPAGPGPMLLTFLMWAVMMAGMMLPSAAPAILLYGTLVRKNGERGTVLPGVWIFTSGYLAVWTLFSLLAALVQTALDRASLLTPMMVSASSTLSAAILIAAGIYEWMPVKQVCLHKCRDPLHLFITRWHPGTAGAFRMGAESGIYCLGCCWLLMLLLFVAGVMSLLWIALIAGFVLVEKLLPAGRFTSRIAGVALVTFGLVMLARA